MSGPTVSRNGGTLTVRETVLRHQQLPDDPDWTSFWLVAGRGGGKTHRGAGWIVRQALRHPGSQWLALGRTWGEVKRVGVLSPGGIRAQLVERDLERFLNGGRWDRAFVGTAGEAHIRFGNGSTIWLGSADRPASLRGLSLSGMWADEVAYYDEAAWDAVLPAVREEVGGQPPRIVGTTTPNGENWLYKRYWAQSDTGVWYASVEGPTPHPPPPDKMPSTFANPFTSEHFRQTLRRAYAGTDVGRQELYAGFLSLSGVIYRLSAADHTRAGVGGPWPDGPDGCDDVIAGQDWGRVASSAFIVLARVGRRWHAVAESVAPADTEDDWAYEVSPHIRRWQPSVIWSDSSHGMENEAQRRRGWPTRDHPKGAGSVAEGIRMVQAALNSGRLVVDADACPVLWDQLRRYRWDTRGGKPTDKPLKVDDHGPDALRYALSGEEAREPDLVWA